MKKMITTCRSLLIVAALCGAAYITPPAATAQEAICHYWSYDGCVDTCDRGMQWCSRRGETADACNNEWDNCEADCNATCFDYQWDTERDRPEV